MAEQPREQTNGRAYIEACAPAFLPWYEMRNWRLSREWLAAHADLITPEVAGDLLRAAGTARAREEDDNADDLALHAKLLDQARHLGVDTAYRLLIGAEAFHDPNAPTQLALLAQIREWMNTPNWIESRVYLAGHLAIVSDEGVKLIRDSYHLLTDAEERATIREHLGILRLVREHGVTEGYRRFLLAR
jgi:hypothetical protein